MRSGGLVQDSLMVKLIVGELSKRGWVETRGNLTSGICLTGPLSVIGGPITPRASDSPTASFLLDGFPRTKNQAQSLDSEVAMNLVCSPFPTARLGMFANLLHLFQVVNLDVPHDAILDRIANRLVVSLPFLSEHTDPDTFEQHEPSGRTYNMTWNKPKNPGVDDITGEPLTLRSDDCPVSITMQEPTQIFANPRLGNILQASEVLC